MRRARFRAIDPPAFKEEGSEKPRIPYPRDFSVEPSVAYDDLIALAWWRRSVRWFQKKPVPRDLIGKAAAVATLSPSACNRPPFLFRVFEEPDVIEKVASLPGGTKGFHQNFRLSSWCWRIEELLRRADRHVIYVDVSLAAMSIVLAAETFGLGTCCINWPDIEVDEERAARVLKLEPDQRPVMFMAVGYPDPEGLVAHSQQKPIRQICRYNFG